MKLNVLNTAHGLIPCYDADFDEKKKLKIGEVYHVEIRLARNYNFHKKYFSLINCAWEYQGEKVVNHFKTVENFRKTVEIAAGHCDTIYSLDKKEWIQVPKSIAFDKMDNASFSDLYERVKDVLFTVFLKGINEQEFMQQLINF